MSDKELNREKLAKAVKDVLEDKESAKKFLLSAGIMDADGKLAEPYRTEETASEELEEEIKRWVYDPCFDLNGVAVKGATDYLTVEDVADIARHFANWQKEQMMKDAVECKVQVNGMNERYLLLHNPIINDNTLNEGDKVKVIIVKED